MNYHIVGDLTSSHLYGSLRFCTGAEFGTSACHAIERLIDPAKVWSATMEDEAYMKWGDSFTGIQDHILMVDKLNEKIQVEELVQRVPIPGSFRALGGKYV